MNQEQKLSPLEELDILKAASLADSETPENLFTDRARQVVNDAMGEDEEEEQSSFLDRLVAFFVARRNYMVWGSLAAVACALAIVLLFPSENAGGQRIEFGQEFSVNAAVDSVKTDGDTTIVEESEFEIMGIDEQE